MDDRWQVTKNRKQLTFFLKLIRSDTKGRFPTYLLQVKVSMRSSSKFILMLGGLGLLVGCSDTNTVIPVATEPDIVTVKLSQAADKASQALDSIAGIERYRTPEPPPEDFSKAPSSLMQPVTLRWSGPMESVVQTLAERAGYKFHAKGNIPSAPLVVNVDVYQQPIMQVLHNIGLQAGHRADLSVDATSGVIEVRYAPADQSQ